MANRTRKSGKTPTNGATEGPAEAKGITRIFVRDFKSLAGEHSIEVRPLTILAGANSSGKSSIMQTLLLMKQTLEAPYDPGALLLDGPNVRISSLDQILPISGRPIDPHSFSAGMQLDTAVSAESTFGPEVGKPSRVIRTEYRSGADVAVLEPGAVTEETARMLKRRLSSAFPEMMEQYQFQPVVRKKPCFLDADYLFGPQLRGDYNHAIPADLRGEFVLCVLNVIHLPGLRGSPSRVYPAIGAGPRYPGPFEPYVASVISQWQADSELERLGGVFLDLEDLALTWKVIVEKVSETQLEVRVGRFLKPGRRGREDFVSIADVGLGVSQALPLVVALHSARPGQVVYIEQPEIHLHPRAQSAMAAVLARAAMRGVRVVAETHSELLILGIRTLVAEGKLPPELVKLHWFQRDAKGVTKITSADLDANGASEDWPDDFADTMMGAQMRYLNAARHTVEPD